MNKKKLYLTIVISIAVILALAILFFLISYMKTQLSLPLDELEKIYIYSG